VIEEKDYSVGQALAQTCQAHCEGFVGHRILHYLFANIGYSLTVVDMRYTLLGNEMRVNLVSGGPRSLGKTIAEDITNDSMITTHLFCVTVIPWF
jgi:hypothetical protein